MKAIFSRLANTTAATPKAAAPQAQPKPEIVRAVKTSYTSLDIPIPKSFLTVPPEKPVTLSRIDFASSKIPEFAEHKAAIISNVLSRDECAELQRLVESTVVPEEGKGTWRPAMINVGAGMEFMDTTYRNSDRIVWDQQEVIDRIWARCLMAEGVAELVSTTPEDKRARGGKWVFDSTNPRMRFLRYSSGQFFKAHTDGAFGLKKDGKEYKTHYTLQLYLNGSDDLKGGETTFMSHDEKRKMPVPPTPGSVLLFQQKSLHHEGSLVKKGTKYSMRAELLYRFELDEEPAKSEEQT